MRANTYYLTSFDTSFSSPNISSVSQLSSLAGAVSTPLVPAFGALSLAFLSARWLQMTLGQNLYVPLPIPHTLDLISDEQI